jgi:hypothetical protein
MSVAKTLRKRESIAPDVLTLIFTSFEPCP